jgi:hypothetical protein
MFIYKAKLELYIINNKWFLKGIPEFANAIIYFKVYILFTS